MTVCWTAVCAQVSFTDVSSQYGLDYVYDGIVSDGSGVSLVDINGDDQDDITIATHFGLNPFLFVVEGDTLLPANMEGLEMELNGSRSLTWVDYDNDGDKDLCITNTNSLLGADIEGIQKLYRRESDTVLVDVTIASGWSLEPFPSYCQAWADYDNDGWLDCYLTQRRGIGNSTNLLYHSNGDGTFTELAMELGVDDTQGMTYQAIFFDYDLDGDVDLFTANDKWATINRFFENNGDGTFSDISDQSGLAANIEGMGVSIGDLNGDGLLDLFVANAGSHIPGQDGGNKMYLNNGDGTWTEVAEELGIGVHLTVWGAHLFDADNDMDLDLFCVNTANDTLESQQFFLNEGGTMTRILDPGLNTVGGNSYGSAIGDIDNDGLYDVVVANNVNDHHQIWLNQTDNENNHIRIELEGVTCNRDAIGSLIEVWTAGQKQIRFTTCGNSYASQDSEDLIIGLGAHESADSVIVRWPGGNVNMIPSVPASSEMTIQEDPDNYLISCLVYPDFEPMVDELVVSASPVDANNVLSSAWYIDGELISSSFNLVWTAPASGSYELCLEVTGPCGTENLCMMLDLECEAPVSNFEIESELLEMSGSFIGSNADSVLWQMGDGTMLSGLMAEHSYANAGDYEVCVYAYNDCSVDSMCQLLEIDCPQPIADFTQIAEDLSISLTNLSQEADSVLWLVDGETQVAGALETLVFDSAGTYEICLVAVNTCGADTLCQSIEVSCDFPEAYFEASSDFLTATFTELSTDADSLIWLMGDGAQFLGDLSTYDYQADGQYLVCLQAFNDCGSDIYCDSLTIGDGVDGLLDIEANFQVSPNPFDEIVTLSFQDITIDNAQVQVLDIRGQLLRTVSLFETQGPIHLDLSELSSGLYFLRFMAQKQFKVITLLKD